MRPGRLTKNKEFQLVYKKGQAFVGRYMVLYVLARRENNKDKRIGFTVGKKIGGAVQRNYVRRRLKEIYRESQPKIKTGNDMVLIARARALNTKFTELQREFGKLFRKAELLD